MLAIDPGILKSLVATLLPGPLRKDEDVAVSAAVDHIDEIPRQCPPLMELVAAVYNNATFLMDEDRVAFDTLVGRSERWDAQRRKRLGVDDILGRKLAVTDGLKTGRIPPIREYVQAFLTHWAPESRRRDGVRPPSIREYILGNDRTLFKEAFRRKCAKRSHLAAVENELIRWANGYPHREALEVSYGKHQRRKRWWERKAQRAADQHLQSCLDGHGSGTFPAGYRGHTPTPHEEYRQDRGVGHMLRHVIIDEAYTSQRCPACRGILRDETKQERWDRLEDDTDEAIRAIVEKEKAEDRKRNSKAEQQRRSREARQRAKGKFVPHTPRTKPKVGQKRGGSYFQGEPKERRRPRWCHGGDAVRKALTDRLRICTECGEVWERDGAGATNAMMKFIGIVFAGRYPVRLPAFAGPQAISLRRQRGWQRRRGPPKRKRRRVAH